MAYFVTVAPMSEMQVSSEDEAGFWLASFLLARVANSIVIWIWGVLPCDIWSQDFPFNYRVGSRSEMQKRRGKDGSRNSNRKFCVSDVRVAGCLACLR